MTMSLNRRRDEPIVTAFILRFIEVFSNTLRCLHRDELREWNCTQLDMLQDSQRASQLVHSSQQMSV